MIFYCVAYKNDLAYYILSHDDQYEIYKISDDKISYSANMHVSFYSLLKCCDGISYYVKKRDRGKIKILTKSEEIIEEAWKMDNNIIIFTNIKKLYHKKLSPESDSIDLNKCIEIDTDVDRIVYVKGYQVHYFKLCCKKKYVAQIFNDSPPKKIDDPLFIENFIIETEKNAIFKKMLLLTINNADVEFAY